MIIFQDIEYRNPILAGRLHADICTIVFGKLEAQFLQTFGKGRKAGWLIFGPIVGVGDTDTGINTCFVDIKSAVIVF